MLNDKILDLEDLVEDPLRVLAHKKQIEDYRDYLRVNYGRIHDGNLEDFAIFPNENYQYQHQISAYVDKGVWKWRCGSCGGSGFVSRTHRYALCLGCLWPGNGSWAEVVLPPNYRQIENLLLQMPGRRSINFLRDWRPDWPSDRLETRVRLARQKQQEGRDLKKLSIAPTRTVSSGESFRSFYWNNNGSEPLDDISGDNGIIEFRAGIKPASFSTAERDALMNVPNGSIIWNETNTRLERYAGSWGPLIESSTATEASDRESSIKFLTPSSLGSFLKIWESADLTWTQDLDLTVAHTLGAVPRGGQISLVCTDAVGGYQVGDVASVWLSPGGRSAPGVGQSVVMLDHSTTSVRIKTNGRNVSIFDSSVGVGDPGIVLKLNADSITYSSSSGGYYTLFQSGIDEHEFYLRPRYTNLHYVDMRLFLIRFWQTNYRMQLAYRRGATGSLHQSQFVGELDLGYAFRLNTGQQYGWVVDSLDNGFEWDSSDLSSAGSQWGATQHNLVAAASSIQFVIVERNSPFVDWDNLQFQERPFVIPHKTGNGVVVVDPSDWDMRVTLWG